MVPPVVGITRAAVDLISEPVCIGRGLGLGVLAVATPHVVGLVTFEVLDVGRNVGLTVQGRQRPEGGAGLHLVLDLADGVGEQGRVRVGLAVLAQDVPSDLLDVGVGGLLLVVVDLVGEGPSEVPLAPLGRLGADLGPPEVDQLHQVHRLEGGLVLVVEGVVERDEHVGRLGVDVDTADLAVARGDLAPLVGVDDVAQGVDPGGRGRLARLHEDLTVAGTQRAAVLAEVVLADVGPDATEAGQTSVGVGRGGRLVLVGADVALRDLGHGDLVTGRLGRGGDTLRQDGVPARAGRQALGSLVGALGVVGESDTQRGRTAALLADVAGLGEGDLDAVDPGVVLDRVEVSDLGLALEGGELGRHDRGPRGRLKDDLLGVRLGDLREATPEHRGLRTHLGLGLVLLGRGLSQEPVVLKVGHDVLLGAGVLVAARHITELAARRRQCRLVLVLFDLRPLTVEVLPVLDRRSLSVRRVSDPVGRELLDQRQARDTTGLASLHVPGLLLVGARVATVSTRGHALGARGQFTVDLSQSAWCCHCGQAFPRMSSNGDHGPPLFLIHQHRG